jgi:hypothetical protein
MIEQHFNCTPTDANKVGLGKAPFKTLGIPIDMGKFVRSAYVRRPKSLDADSKKKVNQTKLVEKMEMCFIIGYGGPISQGMDHDGYKVVISGNSINEEEVIYSSNDVSPVEDMEVTRFVLTGRRHDPLGEGMILRRQFDFEGKNRCFQRKILKPNSPTPVNKD